MHILAWLWRNPYTRFLIIIGIAAEFYLYGALPLIYVSNGSRS